jgi:hypothetical protein
MPFILFLCFLLFSNWLITEIILFIPLTLFEWIKHGLWYIFLGFLIIAVSWFVGE